MSDHAPHRGVRLLAVTLERLRYEEGHDSGHSSEREVRLSWQIERRLASDASNAAQCALRLIASSDPDAPTFLLDATLLGHFEEGEPDEKLPLQKFLEINAPAQLVPFMRELVANLTARSRRGLLMLPSVNVVKLVQQIDAHPAQP